MASPYEVARLGGPTFATPLPTPAPGFVEDGVRVVLDPVLAVQHADVASFEKAGPRARLAFEASDARVGIVTCGGLCPGINNAVRALFMELHHGYGVPEVFGFRFGLEGLVRGEPSRLTPALLRPAHRMGGSILGTSRGRQQVSAMVDTLVRLGLNVLFLVGGNGTLRAADALHQEITRRGLRIGVVVLPKTIDDDVPLLDKTFGFATAVEHARAAIDAAHVEATGARHGIGIVKLMGRDAGFIAATATLASAEVNFCMLPEYPFALGGDQGLLAALEERVVRRGHAVVVVAEGCGAALVGPGAPRDPSGNLRYAAPELDIGTHLRDAVKAHFAASGVPATVKYIDPSYTIRAAPANAADAVYCAHLGRHAAHAGMAGRTGVLVGRVHGLFVHVPVPMAMRDTRHVEADLWQAVREVTGQPALGA